MMNLFQKMLLDAISGKIVKFFPMKIQGESIF